MVHSPQWPCLPHGSSSVAYQPTSATMAAAPALRTFASTCVVGGTLIVAGGYNTDLTICPVEAYP